MSPGCAAAVGIFIASGHSEASDGARANTREQGPCCFEPGISHLGWTVSLSAAARQSAGSGLHLQFRRADHLFQSACETALGPFSQPERPVGPLLWFVQTL